MSVITVFLFVGGRRLSEGHVHVVYTFVVLSYGLWPMVEVEERK